MEAKANIFRSERIIRKLNSWEWINSDEMAFCKNNAEIFKNFRFVRRKDGICRSRQTELRNKASVSDE